MNIREHTHSSCGPLRSTTVFLAAILLIGFPFKGAASNAHTENKEGDIAGLEDKIGGWEIQRKWGIGLVGTGLGLLCTGIIIKPENGCMTWGAQMTASIVLDMVGTLIGIGGAKLWKDAADKLAPARVRLIELKSGKRVSIFDPVPSGEG